VREKESENMSEEKLTSNTLEIEEKRLSNLSANEKKESYKTISEDKLDGN
jgi:hypothetical protein